MALSGTDFDSSASVLFRVKHTDVEGTLTNFPVALELGASVGIKSNDNTAIFDELGSTANRLKIAVEHGDTGTQCYVDIEYWDDATEDATLHVKVPSVSNSEYTYLRLYYDSGAADNTTYVSDSGGTAAQSVYDSNYKFVAHHANDPNGDPANAIKDSTSSNYDGTPSGTMLTADLVDAFSIGKGIDFDDTDDYISFGTAGPNITGDLTIDLLFKPNSIFNSGLATDEPFVDRNAATGNQYRLEIDAATGKLQLLIDATAVQSTTASWASGTAFVVTAVLDSGNHYYFWKDGVADGDGATAATLTGAAGNTLYTAYDGTNFLDGIIGEVRISDKVREDEWIKATKLSLTDTLVTSSVSQATVSGNLFSSGLKSGIELSTTVTTIEGTLFEISSDISIIRRPTMAVTGTLLEFEGSVNIHPISITGSLLELSSTISMKVNSKAALSGSLFTFGGSLAVDAGKATVIEGTILSISSTIDIESEGDVVLSGTLFEITGEIDIYDHSALVISGTLLEMASDILAITGSETVHSYSRFTKC